MVQQKLLRVKHLMVMAYFKHVRSKVCNISRRYSVEMVNHVIQVVKLLHQFRQHRAKLDLKMPPLAHLIGKPQRRQFCYSITET